MIEPEMVIGGIFLGHCELTTLTVPGTLFRRADEPEHGTGCVFGVFWSRNLRGGGSCPSRILAGPWGPSFGSFLGETDGPFLGADLRC